jgi:hypothetical protein
MISFRISASTSYFQDLCGFALVFAAMGLSAVNPNISVVLSCTVCVFVAFRDPRAGLALALFIASIREVWALSVHDTSIILTFAVLATVLASMRRMQFVELRHALRAGNLFILLLGVSLFFEVLHFPILSAHWSVEGAQRIALETMILLVALLASLTAGNLEIGKTIKFTLVAAGIFTAAVDLLYLYVPAPWLIGNEFVHTEMLRLVGLQDDANSTARFLLPMAIGAVVLFFQRPGLWQGVIIIIAALPVFATGSKTGILTLIACSTVAAYVCRPPIPRLLSGGIAVILVLIAGLSWSLVFEHPFKRHAAEAWLNSKLSQDRAIQYAYGTYTGPITNITDYLFGSLRIGRASQLTVMPPSRDAAAPVEGSPPNRDAAAPVEGSPANPANPPQTSESTSDKIDWSRVREVKGPASATTTGQRILLWTTGLDVIRDHPLFGIGDDNWRAEMQERTGFPYSSPHNGLLQVTGSYGVLGAIIYLIALSQMCLLIYLRQGDPWVLVCAAGYFCFEMFDVSTIFSPTFVSIWVWALLGQFRPVPATQQVQTRSIGTLGDHYKLAIATKIPYVLILGLGLAAVVLTVPHWIGIVILTPIIGALCTLLAVVALGTSESGIMAGRDGPTLRLSDALLACTSAERHLASIFWRAIAGSRVNWPVVAFCASLTALVLTIGVGIGLVVRTNAGKAETELLAKAVARAEEENKTLKQQIQKLQADSEASRKLMIDTMSELNKELSESNKERKASQKLMMDTLRHRQPVRRRR